MYPVTQRFLDTITGSHIAVVRVQVLPTDKPQFGPNPTGGVELPLLDGDVKLTSTADVNGTVDFIISGDYWDLLQPYGAELFVERGIDYGDGTREYVPCGYYGIEEITQDKAPSGPIRVSGADRSRRLLRNRVIYPIEFPAGSTHRVIFDHLVNAIVPPGVGSQNYAMFLGATVPIIWTGYDPTLAKIGTSLTCEDNALAFLSKIADARGCVLRFSRHGELLVQPRSLPPGALPVYSVGPGLTGNLIGASRKVTRDGVYNYVVARGSDPANPTGYRLAYNNDPTSPLRWYGPFGVVVRYYASPLILDNDAADAAAETVLTRYKGLPSSLTMLAVPNPALDPLDVVAARIGNQTATHLTDRVTIPLVGEPVQIVTRVLNEIPTDDDIGGGTGTFPNPADPGAGTGGPGGGGGGGADLTTAAGRFNWGVPLGSSDEFTSATLDTTKWAVYNDPALHRVPAQVTILNGVLTLTGLADGSTAGLTHQFQQRYGRWEVRARSSNTSTSGTTFHPTLTVSPTSNQSQDGEYDFLQNDTPGAASAGAVMHYPQSASAPTQQISHSKAGVDLTQWHNFGFEWSTDGVRGFVDGVEWFNDTGGAISGTRSNIQDMPSGHLAIQLDNPGGSAMQAAKFEIEWVRTYTLVPSGGGGGVVGTTMPDILRLGKAAGLTKVNLGVDFLPGDGPAGKEGTHVDFDLTAIENDLVIPGYADIRSDGAERLTSYVGAATTPNSTHSRTEYRELAENGVDKASWSSTSGEHYVWVRGAIRKLTPGRPHLVIAQLHSSNDDVATIRVEGSNVESTYGNSGRPGQLTSSLVIGQTYEYMIKVSGSTISYYWDDMVNPAATQSYSGSSGLYFKFGNYHQSTTSTDSQGEQAIVDLYDSEIWHTGYAEPTPRHSEAGGGGTGGGGTTGMPAITLSGNQIMRDGQPWWLLGYNSFVWSGDCGTPSEVMTAQQVDDWFASMRHDGHGAVRLFFFQGWDLTRLDAAVASAKKYNVYLCITLDDAIGGCGTSTKSSSWFGNSSNTTAYQNHMTTLLNRYKGETAIAWFEYFNEPSDYGGALRTFYDNMGSVANGIDPSRLFSAGTLADYDTNGPSGYLTINQSPGVDIASLHEYDDNEVESNHGPVARTNSAGKPVIVGEFGINANSSGSGCAYSFSGRASLVTQKAGVYTAGGYAGALAWAWQPSTGASTCDTSNLDVDAPTQDALRTFGGVAPPPPGGGGGGGGTGVMSSTIASIVTLTQAQYDGLGSKDARTLYNVVPNPPAAGTGTTVTSGEVTNIVALTSSAYNSLSSRDSKTVYVLMESSPSSGSSASVTSTTVDTIPARSSSEYAAISAPNSRSLFTVSS